MRQLQTIISARNFAYYISGIFIWSLIGLQKGKSSVENSSDRSNQLDHEGGFCLPHLLLATSELDRMSWMQKRILCRFIWRASPPILMFWIFERVLLNFLQYWSKINLHGICWKWCAFINLFSTRIFLSMHSVWFAFSLCICSNRAL